MLESLSAKTTDIISPGYKESYFVQKSTDLIKLNYVQ